MEEKSLFVEFMGDSPMIKVIGYLITERELDFSITYISKKTSEIHYSLNPRKTDEILQFYEKYCKGE